MMGCYFKFEMRKYGMSDVIVLYKAYKAYCEGFVAMAFKQDGAYTIQSIINYFSVGTFFNGIESVFI